MSTTEDTRPAARPRRSASLLAEAKNNIVFEDETVKPERRKPIRKQQQSATTMVTKHSSSNSKKRARSSTAEPAVKEENDSAAGASRSISNSLSGKMVSSEKGPKHTYIYSTSKPISPVTPVQSPVRQVTDTTAIQFHSPVRQKPDGLMSPPRNSQNCKNVGLVRPLNRDQADQTEPLNLSMGESSGSGGRRIPATTSKPYNSLISPVTPGDHLSSGEYAAVVDPSSTEVKRPKPKQVVHPFPKNEDPSSPKCNHQEETPKPAPTSNTQESNQQQEIMPSNQSKKRKLDADENEDSTSPTTSTTPPKRERLISSTSSSSSSTTRGGRSRSKSKTKGKDTRKQKRKPKWEPAGKMYMSNVYSPDHKDQLVVRQCYPAVERVTRNGERSQIMIGDCVFVNSTERYDKPFVAYVNAIFIEENTEKNIKLWVTWFYRYVDMEIPPGPGPEAGEGGGKWPNSYPVSHQNPGGLATPADEGELFASTHMDNILVGTVHDLSYVLSANDYNHMKALAKAKERGIAEEDTLCGRLLPLCGRLLPSCSSGGRCMKRMREIRSELQETLLDGESVMDDELMFFCRYFYDAFGTKKVRKNFYRSDYMKMLRPRSHHR